MPTRASKHPPSDNHPPPRAPFLIPCVPHFRIFDCVLIRPPPRWRVFRLSRSTTLIKSKSNYHLDFMLIKSQSRRGWRTDEPLPFSLCSPPGHPSRVARLHPSQKPSLRTSLAFAPCPPMRQISLRPERSIDDKFGDRKGPGIH